MTIKSHVRTALLFVLMCCLVIAGLVALSQPALAQVAGATLSGLVTDTSGATVPGVTVSIKNVGTGAVHEVKANEGGFYSVPNLLPGTYDITFSAQGFSQTIQKGVVLTVGAEQALNANLKPGQVKEIVEVTSLLPDIQTTTSAV